MIKLKSSVINRILEELDSEDFCKEDFEIQEPGNSKSLVKIIFPARPEYYFEIIETVVTKKRKEVSAFSAIPGFNQEYEEEENVILTTESPGDYKIIESKKLSSLDNAINRIQAWTRNIKEEITISSLDNETSVEEDLEWFKEKVNDDIERPNEPFTQDEIQVLSEKLDSLKERIDDLEIQLDNGNNLKEQAENTIQRTKDDLEKYPRGIWYRTAGNKLLNLMKTILKTQEGRQLVTETIKSLLKGS